jgi:hypothetical protein
MRALVTLAVLLSALLSTLAAHAEPQANAGILVGGAGVGAEGEFWDHAEFHLGLRSDVMFGRSGPEDFGAGPYVELGTFAFDQLDFGGGAQLLLPVADALPLIVSAGAFGRYGDDDYGLEPGVSGGLFFGSRSYNFHASYVMQLGLFAGYRYSFGESHESALVVAAHIDLALIGVPFILLANFIRGPTGEAGPIED